MDIPGFLGQPRIHHAAVAATLNARSDQRLRANAPSMPSRLANSFQTQTRSASRGSTALRRPLCLWF